MIKGPKTKIMYATQEQLKYLSEHMNECRKHGYNKYRMLVVSDSNESGKKNSQIMQSLYPDAALKDNSGGYRDFSMEFTYMWQRDQAVTDVNTAVGGYRQQHFQYEAPSEDPETEDPGTGIVVSVVDSVDDASTGQKSSNTVIFIVIGVAVVAAALLLIPKK